MKRLNRLTILTKGYSHKKTKKKKKSEAVAIGGAKYGGVWLVMEIGYVWLQRTNEICLGLTPQLSWLVLTVFLFRQKIHFSPYIFKLFLF